MIKKYSKKGLEKRKEKVEKTKELHLFFLSLWNKLPKKKNCICCGKSILGGISTMYFDHLLPKSKFPRFSLDERNIYYPVCGDCHSSKEMGFPLPNHKKAIENAKILLLS